MFCGSIDWRLVGLCTCPCAHVGVCQVTLIMGACCMMSGGVRESLLSGLECEKHATIVLDHARVRMWVIHGVLRCVARRLGQAPQVLERRLRRAAELRRGPRTMHPTAARRLRERMRAAARAAAPPHRGVGCPSVALTGRVLESRIESYNVRTQSTRLQCCYEANKVWSG